MKKAHASVESLARELLRIEGKVRGRRLLEELVAVRRGAVLTIIANQSFHGIPQRYLRGQVYVASRGKLDLSSAAKAKAVYAKILQRLVRILASNNWKEIYLIPTGHPTLSAAIKLAVYQVTRRNTVDVFYADGKYFDLRLSVRDGA